MRFAVRTVSADNRMQTLLVEGADAAAARLAVEARGLTAISIEGRGARERGDNAGFSVIEFSQELVALLGAGLGVVEALEGLLEKETSARGRAIYAALLGRLREGHRLSAALRADSSTFDPLFVGVVQAAEGTSDLPRTLARYVDYRQRMLGLRSRVVSASIYPAVLLVVGGAVALFLMGYVVPRFALVYQDAGRELPWASRWLLNWGEFAARHGAMIAVGITSLLVAAAFGLRAAWRSGRLVNALQRVPAIGQRIRVGRLSQLYLTLGMLLEGGIPVLTALDMLRSSASPVHARGLDGARAMIAAGSTLSQAFDSQGLATSIALRLLRVGERSGQLGSMLGRTAAFHEAETARWIERFSRLFEPLLMTAIGALIGLIVILLYMPIFDLAGSFG